MLLENMKGEVLFAETNCGSWRCLGCRDRNRARFRAIVKYGVSTLGPCMFTTLTYKEGVQRLRHAGCVSKDWKAFYRLLRKREPQLAKKACLRVMELTKAGTPHFHLLTGPISSDERIRCWREPFDVSDYLRGFNN